MTEDSTNYNIISICEVSHVSQLVQPKDMDIVMDEFKHYLKGKNSTKKLEILKKDLPLRHSLKKPTDNYKNLLY